MSARTRLASASASAFEMVSTRVLCMSTLARLSWASASICFTSAFCLASIIAVAVCSLDFTTRCSWFSSARFFLPFSVTSVCSFLRFSSSMSISALRWISPFMNSCSRLVFSMRFFISVVFSRLCARDWGSVTEVTVQLEMTTPVAANFLFRCASIVSARFPRSVRTCWWVCCRTRYLMPSSTAPERSSSKCTAPSLYTNAWGSLIMNTMTTSTPMRTLSFVGHSFTGALYVQDCWVTMCAMR
mmetsp:Transcript_65295/g.183865  ORF Transcript_65295/g.183865 Transcript_65295/m.183865 type:complete len:243 (+) Transcript_65295:366-1094(+)